MLGKYLLAWMNTLRLNLAEVGLKPDRADKTPSLEQYLASRESAPSAHGATSGPR